MRLAGVYLSRLEIRPVAGTSLVEIKFTTPDPALSARLANAHAASYVRYGIDLRARPTVRPGVPPAKADGVERTGGTIRNRLEQLPQGKGIISVDEKSNVIIDGSWI